MTYKTSRSAATAVDGVSVDITVRDVGAGERDTDLVLMALLEELGRVATAFDEETPPRDLDEVPDEKVPLMTPAWEQRFGDEDDDAPEAEA